MTMRRAMIAAMVMGGCTAAWAAPAATEAKQVYTDAENGVSFAYGAEWRPLDEAKDTMYLRPAIQPVKAAFVLDVQDAPYPGTDFSGLSFSYAIGPATTAAGCTAAVTQYGDTAPAAAVVINGRRFAAAEGGDAAINHQIRERLYSAFANGRCYLFDLALTTGGFGVDDDVRQMREAEIEDAEHELDTVMGTVKIAAVR